MTSYHVIGMTFDDVMPTDIYLLTYTF